MAELKSQKYQQIINTALELFQQYGLKKVSVEEICKNAGVSKMTFYKFFKNKSDLIDKVWSDQFKLGLQRFEEIENMDVPFTEKIHLLLKMKEESTKKIGPGFVKEYTEIVPEFMKKYAEQYSTIMQRFQEFIEAHQKKGEVRASMRPDFFLKVVAKLMELTQDKELVESYDSLKDFALEVNNFMYYGIMPIPDSETSNE